MAVIDWVEIRDHSISPTEAEVWITALPHWDSPTLELRGRLMGPRCRYTATVEVAYPLSPFPRPPDNLAGITRRVVIPEPSLWDPETPFLYQGPVELWEGGKRGDSATLTHGLRTFQLGPRGLRINGRQLVIRGVAREPASEAEALRLREGGRNLLLAPTTNADLWGLASHLGFLVLGRVEGTSLDNPVFGAAEYPYPRLLHQHPSCFGWLLPEKVLSLGAEWWDSALPKLQAGSPHFLAVELTRPPTTPVPKAVHLIVCDEALLPALAEVHRPKIVTVEERKSADEEAALLASAPGVLGWIEQ